MREFLFFSMADAADTDDAQSTRKCDGISVESRNRVAQPNDEEEMKMGRR